MADVPLIAVVVAKELRAGQKEAPPARSPQSYFIRPVGGSKNGSDDVHVLVHPTHPHFERLGVMHAVDRPLVDELERVREVEEKVV